jgi:hypothetical protein
MLNDMADGNGNSVATKADLADLGAEVRADVVGFRAELKADIESLRTATKADIESVKTATKADIESAKMETFERIERSETTLLKEFRKWMSRNDAQLKLHGARDISYDQRISLLEGRVAELEEHR